MSVRKSYGPSGADGEAHLFRDGPGDIRLVASATTGCFAIRDSAGHTRIHHWYFRTKGKDPVVVENVSWVILWACKSPQNAEPKGFITYLGCQKTGLVSLDVRSLSQLAFLRCEFNDLTRLDVSGLRKLKSLSCRGNELEQLTATDCPELKRIDSSGNTRLYQPTSVTRARALGEPERPWKEKAMTSTSLFDL